MKNVLYLVFAGFVVGRCAVELYFAVTVASVYEKVKLLEGPVAIRRNSFPNVVVDHILTLLL
jgi:hypothetical protein